MRSMLSARHVLFLTVCALLAVPSIAADFDLAWHTMDGGGGYSSSSTFELTGTIGQPDAGPMTGGMFELSGGFWPAFVPRCSCLGDMNGDGAKNGSDIQRFVTCVISGGSCTCADLDTLNGVTLDDATLFVDDLLADAVCP